MATLPTLQQQSSGTAKLQNVLDLITNASSTFAGKKTTQTQNTSTSAEGLNSLLKQILESTQGLAAVSGGQKTAGLYNSSTNSLLTNDLLTRASGEVASRNQTTTQTVATPAAVNPLNALILGSAITGGKALLGPTLATAKDKLGVEDLGTQISNAIFGNSSATGASAIPQQAINVANTQPDQIGSLYSGGFLEGASGATTASSASADSSVAIADGANALDTSYSAGVSSGMDGAFSDATTGATGSVPYLAVGKQLLDGNLSGAVGTGVGGYLGSAIGTAIFPGVGTAIGSFLGSTIGGGCFITTAVCKYLGKNDNCEELTTLRKFRDEYMLSTEEGKKLVSQYYVEAPDIVTALEKLPTYYKAGTYRTLNNYITWAITHINLGNNEAAQNVYVTMFEFAKDLVKSHFKTSGE